MLRCNKRGKSGERKYGRACHCEERSDEAIQGKGCNDWDTALDCFASLAMTARLPAPRRRFGTPLRLLPRFEFRQVPPHCREDDTPHHVAFAPGLLRRSRSSQ
jgi:hypothetical protein